MEWVSVNPSRLHEVCGLLGHVTSTGEYHIKTETCEDAVNELFEKLNNDGPSLRIRRNLGVCQVIRKDLVPLLIASSREHPKVIPKIIKLLSHLTSPIECLVPATYVATEEGKQVVFELDSLLRGTKLTFADFRATKAIVDHLKTLTTKVDELSTYECEGVSDGLLLLRNILHIAHNDAGVQNQILWNLFAHSLDKILLYLMTCSQKGKWGIALVQLIALIYKDQHVTNLQKLLNEWLENSMSESSEDEGNTSPPHAAESRDDSSSEPILTSDPTSDSSDTGQGGKQKGVNTREQSKCIPLAPNTSLASGLTTTATFTAAMRTTTSPIIKEPFLPGQKVYTKAKSKSKAKAGKERMSDVDSGISSSHFSTDKIHLSSDGQARNDPHVCISRPHPSTSAKQGSYNRQEGNSTSSNEDDSQQSMLAMMAKQRTAKSSHGKVVAKLRVQPMITVSILDKTEMRKKKLHKRKRRDKTSIKAVVHHNPTDEDISLVLREFTVDFLLKGYGSLVALLQEQFSRSATLQVDKSHFLWLITYFLKFASQIEIDFDLIGPLLNMRLFAYLTYEGVQMCENLAISNDVTSDLKPHLRRMHLVVTAIRELIHTVEMYSKQASFTIDDEGHLSRLQYCMIRVEELRYLFLLLTRHFKPGVQSKQYLQDLITTNHVFLLLLEKISAHPEHERQFKMYDFIKEFASPLIMQQYGHLLEDFRKNGEFVNDCVFTMMHHIAGDLSRPEVLYQPLILKTFSNIWEVEFEIKDDWADLIEYVIQKFMKASSEEKRQIFKSGTSNTSEDNGWSKEDLNNLYWFYTKCTASNDPIGKIMELYGGGGLSGKSRESILNQLLHQRIIGYNQFLKHLASEKLEAGESSGIGAFDLLRSNTSSSQATAGSSCHCHSPPPRSVLMDHLREANQNSFSFQAPISSTNSVAAESEISKEEVEDDLGSEYAVSNSDEDQESHIVSNAITANKISPPPEEPSGGHRMNVSMDVSDLDNALAELISQILREGQDLAWLQKQILQACHVKFNFETKRFGYNPKRHEEENDELSKVDDNPCESQFEIAGSVPYHFTLLGQSIPIVPWTHYQEILLMSPPYLLLLHKLGFHLPGDVGKLFPRIPYFWTSDVLLTIATKLGPMPSKDALNFDLTRLMELMETAKLEGESLAASMAIPSSSEVLSEMSNSGNKDINFTLPDIVVPGGVPFPFGSAAPHALNWMTYVHKSKMNRKNSDADDSSISSVFSEHNLDDCASLKALPPTDQSDDITMISEASGHEDDDSDDEEEVKKVTNDGSFPSEKVSSVI